MTRNFLLTFIYLTTLGFVANAQGIAAPATTTVIEALERKVNALTQQTTFLRGQLKLSATEKQQLLGQVATQQKTILVRNDSIAELHQSIQILSKEIGLLQKEADQLNNTITQRTDELKTATTQIRQLEYDKKNLVDNRIVRIYNYSAADVRKQFLQSLAISESGFQYDDALIDDEIQITRNFNDQAEAWWVFDKTLDTILELKIRIKPHLYDPQKCIVFGETKLLQKTRYSNKPFEEQRDQEKINLYREKAFHMLEGKLKGTSDK